MPGTLQPQGLIIERDVMKFTISWKVMDTDYNAGQQVRWRYSINNGKNWTGYTTWNISPLETSSTVSLNAADFFPWKNKFLNTLEFSVRGKRANTSQDGKVTVYDWSWWTYKTMIMFCPQIPNIESVTLDSELDNVCHFTYDEPNAYPHDHDPTNRNPYINTEWQTILVKECHETDGAKLTWKAGVLGWSTGNDNNPHRTITWREEPELLARNSCTRWFRFRARGPGPGGWSMGAANTGCSYWRYAKHVYAMPIDPHVRSATHESTKPWIRVNWDSGANNAHPLDQTTVEYAIGVPRANLAPPSNPSWTVARTFQDGVDPDETFFLIETIEQLALDNMVWVRIGVRHDRNYQASPAARVMVGSVPYNGGLTAPSGLTVTNINTENHRADIHVVNNSQVPDAKIAIIYRQTGYADMVVGYLNPGQTDVTVQCPNWGTGTFSFAVYAFQGTTTATSSRGVTAYTVKANLKSATITTGGNVPMPPTNIRVTAAENGTEAIVTWNWSWSAGTIGMEISWSQNQYAWESTDQPQTYTVTDIHAARWRIAGLDAGTWYFRLRQTRENGDATSYGPYSDIVTFALGETAEDVGNTPLLTLAESVVPKTGEISASWVFEMSDTNIQTYAEICEATVEDGVTTYGEILKHVTTDQHTTLTIPDSWEVDSTHFLCVRLRLSVKGMTEWSAPASVIIAKPTTCTIASTSLVTRTVVKDDLERECSALTEMPFTITIEDVADSENLTVSIVRVSDYRMKRPDESEYDGYEGETIYSHTQTGSGTIIIQTEDLVGHLDDGAIYKIVAQASDKLGQSTTSELNFDVIWDHQALVPDGTAQILDEYGVAKLTPTAPEGALDTDVCDIYRLSVDKPVLVYQNATFGESYIDPYPTIGEYGGYRFVFKTANGDYITEDNVIAWHDVNTDFKSIDHLIDFGGNQARLRYNVDLSSSWAKDFKETQYLGGSVQGDWNPGVSRTGSVNAVSVIATDQETITAMRRLAVYSGVCHVRTRDGSSYDADVEVSESRGHEPSDLTTNFSMTVTRIDGETNAGIPYDIWLDSIQGA